MTIESERLAAYLMGLVGGGGGGGGPVSWDAVTGKPATFPPTVPITQADVTGLVAALAGKLTQAAADGLYRAASWVPAWSEVTGKPTTFAPTAHAHAQSEVTGLATALADRVTGPELSLVLADYVLGSVADTLYAPLVHAHAFADLTGKPTTVAGYGITDALTPTAGDARYRPIGYVPSWTEVTGKPATFAPTIGATGTTAVAGNDARLTDARTPTAHTHPASEISDSTATGRSVLTAASATAARTAIGAQAPATTLAGYGITDAVLTTDARLSDARAPLAHTQAASTISDSTAAGRALLTAADAAAQRTALAVPAATDVAQTARLSANVALAASTTINATGLDFAVPAAGTYQVYGRLYFTVSAGTVGLKPVWATGPTGVGTWFGTTVAATTTGVLLSTTPTTASATAFGTASFTGFIEFDFTLTFAAAGTMRIGVTTGASAAGNLLAGSYRTVVKVA